MISEPKLKRIVTGEWNEHIDKLVELKEEFQYLDPPDGIIKGPWSLKRFDYLTDLSDKQRLMMAKKLYKFNNVNYNTYLLSNVTIPNYISSIEPYLFSNNNLQNVINFKLKKIQLNNKFLLH